MNLPARFSATQSQSRVPSVARFMALLVLFTVGSLVEIWKLTALRDTDVWWRLRTGIWITQMHALPHNATFSRYAELPWTASGWLFDLLLAFAYHLVGLAALPMAVMLGRWALAVVLLQLAGGGTRRAWLPAISVAALALWLVGPQACGPLALSGVFYGAELAMLLHARKSGDVRILYALPVLFFLWANLGPEFVCGLLPLAVFICVAAAHAWIPSLGSFGDGKLRLPVLLALGTGAAGAPLLAPYSFHLYENFFAELYSVAGFKYFPEMHALGFRQPRDFALALFLLGAFFVLGRRRDLFLFLLLVLTLPVAFRIQRDAWMALLPATAVFALLWQTEGDDKVPDEKQFLGQPAAVLGSLIVVMAGGLMLPAGAQLQRVVSERFPVEAAGYVRDHKLPAPLFHWTAWGGYLTYALPEYSVAMDDRIALYGDSAYVQMRQLADAEVPLDSVPAFAEARTLLLPADSGLAKALTTRQEFRMHYRVVHQDALAVVLQTQ